MALLLLLLLGLEVLLALVLAIVGIALLLAILLAILRVSLLLLVVLTLVCVLVVSSILLTVLIVAALVASIGLARHEGARAGLERLRSGGEGGRIVEIHALRLLREALLLLLPVVRHGDGTFFL